MFYHHFSLTIRWHDGVLHQDVIKLRMRRRGVLWNTSRGLQIARIAIALLVEMVAVKVIHVIFVCTVVKNHTHRVIVKRYRNGTKRIKVNPKQQIG